MPFHRIAFRLLCICAICLSSQAIADDNKPIVLDLELNTVSDIGSACRLTFVARNQTGTDIEQAVFETVTFDISGTVVSLSLFDFRTLPFDTPRVRQFDVPDITCDDLGHLLINGVSTCFVDGAQSALCNEALSVSSRTSVELLG